MATLDRTYHPSYSLRVAVTKKVDAIIEALLPRRCVVVSASLLLVGFGIPFLMMIGLLSANLLFGLAGFILASTGGVLALTLCGEL